MLKMQHPRKEKTVLYTSGLISWFFCLYLFEISRFEMMWVWWTKKLKKNGSDHFKTGEPSGRKAEQSSQHEDTRFLEAGWVRLWVRIRKGLRKEGNKKQETEVRWWTTKTNFIYVLLPLDSPVVNQWSAFPGCNLSGSSQGWRGDEGGEVDPTQRCWAEVKMRKNLIKMSQIN